MSLAPDKTAILTYHRILSDRTTSKFHDVPFDQFRDQMRIVARRHVDPRDARIYITFDDGTDDHLRAGELLHELGLSGVFFIITGRLGQVGYLTQQQVIQLSRLGHVVGSHGMSHRHLPSLSPVELDNELMSSKFFLEDLVGAKVDWIAPPGGVYNRVALDRALTLGYRVFRTMDWGYAPFPPEGRVDCLPVLRQYPLTTFERLLDGAAPLWRYRLKNALKTIVGERIYNGLRNRLAS